MKTLLNATLSLVLAVLLASCTKEETNPNLVREFSITSVSNGATYPVKVALPENYDATHKYSVLYVLDGEDNFDFTANNCSEISKELSVANVLVVSIGYGNDRTLDYTPTVANEGGGGAEKFLAFIRNELVPKIENDFGGDTSRQSRIILGHSFGGLCAAYAFTNQNDLFGNYILLSPSLWYDNEVVLKYEQENRANIRSERQVVFMGIGELENSGRMMAPYMAFYQALDKNYPDLRIASHLEPHMDHLGSKNPNIVEGLKFYFQNR